MNPGTQQELVLTRVFDAPRELVFRTWSDPRHVARWWGPRGFTNPVCEWDARPGGKMLVHMTGPDGTVYPMAGEFEEVVEPERLVFVDRALETDAGEWLLEVRTTVDFADLGGRTEVTLRAQVLKAAPEAGEALAGMEQGWSESLDKLAEEVSETEAAAFTLCRDFAVPRERLFAVWTEREHLLRWWGPKSFEVVHCTNDLRPGGLMHYALRAPKGGEMWGRWLYREISPPERLVFVSSFSDPDAQIARAPFPGEWPPEMLTTVTFAEHEGGTRLTLRSEAVNATEAERRTFRGAHDSMTNGWGGTMEQLEAYLAKG